jgi:endonuclease/exonuclease/phosphatase (EEP) superfamily protein YafD
MWLWRACVLLVAIAVAFLWFNLSENPERRPVLALLQYLPYPAYLGPTIVAACLSLFLGWAWRLLAVSSLIVVLTAIMGLCVGQPDEGHAYIRVMTYNAKAYYAASRPRGFEELAMEVMQHDPDVLVMQDSGDLVRLQHDKPDVFYRIVGHRQTYGYGQYLIASRYPLKGCGPGLMPFESQMHSFAHCVVQVHGQEVDLVTVHFVTPREGLNAARRQGLRGLRVWSDNMNHRLGQAGLLAEHMRQFKPQRPRIVAGDLNAPESSAVVKTLLHTGLRDAYSSAGLGYGFTHGHSLKLGISWLRIDHILVSDSIGVAHAYVGGKIASEHRPVIADLLLVRQ